MNTSKDPLDQVEVEWRAQERARLGAADADERDVRVANALREVPEIGLPADFAIRVAGLVRAQATNDSRFEEGLLRGLLLLFAISAMVTVAWFGRSWPADLAAALPGGRDAVGWTAIAAVCAICNWCLGLLRHRHGGDSSAHH